MKISINYNLRTNRNLSLPFAKIFLNMLIITILVSFSLEVELKNNFRRSDVIKEHSISSNKIIGENSIINEDIKKNDIKEPIKTHTDIKDANKIHNENTENHIITIDRKASDDCKVSSVNIPEGSDSPIMVFKARINNDEYTFMVLKKADLEKYDVKGEMIHSDKSKDLIWYKHDDKLLDLKSHRVKDAFSLCRRINLEYMETGQIHESHRYSDSNDKINNKQQRISKILPEGVTLKSE